VSPIDGPWEHLDIAANGARFHLAVGRRFAASRRLVVLLHGFAEFWWAWRHQLDPLDAAGYAVAALDLRGYGDSDKTPHGYDVRTTAGDVAGVIRGLGHRRAVLVGHDWGGVAAWATTAYVPEQVRALAMIAAPFPLGRGWHPPLAYAALPGLAERRLIARDGARVERLLRERAAPDRDWLSATDARRYREALGPWPSARCACEYARIYARDRFRAAGRDFRRRLHDLEPRPLLSIHGQLDPILSLAEMSAAGPYVGGRHQIVSLPGVGHLPHEEDPTACTAALLRWLDDLD
jgi:pimeloyl-ACP methyl ester carboxylesterase